MIMTDNKDLKYTQQFKKELSIPKTETKIVLNDWSQEIKKSPLSAAARNKVVNRSGSNYLSENQGYGPTWGSGHDAESWLASKQVEEGREWAKKEKEARLNKRCIECSGSTNGEDSYCEYHKRKNKEAGWMITTVADTAASIFIPGYAPVKAVAGAVSWVAEKAEGLNNPSSGNIVKDEIKSEAWDIGATAASGSSKFGGYYSAGIGIARSAIDWANHQNHVDNGENYRSDCSVCRY